MIARNFGTLLVLYRKKQPQHRNDPVRDVHMEIYGLV